MIPPGMCTRVVAAGLAEAGRARVVVTVLPCKGGDIQSFPMAAHDLLDALASVQASYRDGTTGPDLPITGKVTFPPDRRDHLLRLWQRIMAGSEAEWDQLLQVFDGSPAPPTQRAQAPVVPLPMAEAGVAIPLERARAALDGLARPGSPLLARGPTRPPATALSSLGRPWLGHPGATVQLASRQTDTLTDAARTLLLGPPSVADWVAARTVGDTDAQAAGDLAYASPLDLDALAGGALGRDGTDMLGVFDRLHALMHAAITSMTASPASANSAPPESGGPTRRAVQLLAAPSLMRLFGLARDFVVDVSRLPDGLWGLCLPCSKVTCASSLWRAAQLFYPASEADWNTGVVKDVGAMRLGDPKRYVIVTVEPALAGSSLYRKPDVSVEPQGGGLALVALDPALNTQATGKAGSILFSDNLESFQRLDVGVETVSGMAWHCAMHRTTSWSDPAPEHDTPAGWIEQVLAHLGTGGLARWELDAAVCLPSVLHPDKEAPLSLKDTRLAVYTGTPGGVAADEPYWDTSGKRFRWGHPEQKLAQSYTIALSQSAEVPGSAVHQPPAAALVPRLRFGWRYRVGLRRVWLGGVTRPVAELAAAYAVDDAPQPALGAPARAYLRHEPIRAPLVTLPPSVPASGDSGPLENRLQTCQQAALVTWGLPRAGRQAVHATERVLLVPPVSLEFAALHEVLDNAPPGRKRHLHLRPPSKGTDDGLPRRPLAIDPPEGGLRRLDLSGAVETDPDHARSDAASEPEPRVRLLPVGAEDTHDLPYYPDPAACFVAIGLREKNSNTWAVTPRLARLRADLFTAGGPRWPDPLPVRVVLRAGARGERSLELREAPDGLVAADARIAPHPALVAEVILGPGEQANLLVWFVPAMDDLAAWFDICGSIQQLALQEAGASATAGDAACKAGLTTLLGAAACARSQGDSEDDGRRRVASLLWDRLRQEAEPLIAQVGTIALVHAVPRPLTAPSVKAQRPIAVARRLDVDARSAAGFLGRVPDTASWPGRQDEDDAVGVVVGGTVLLDLASTAGLIVVADLASPNGPLDPAALAAPTDSMLVPADPEVPKAALVDGRPAFKPQRVTLLEIAGVPSASGGAPQPLDLAALQLQALEAGTTLRVTRPAHFADGGARRLTVHVGALPRHAALLELDDDQDIVWAAQSIALWLNATIRPSVPEPIELLPLFTWEEQRPGWHDPVLVWTKARSAGLRLTLRQPWFSAGEGEELGIVFWPPPDAALPQAVGTRSPDENTLSELWEEDIGPLGPFVSAWGRDPLRTTEPAGTTRFALQRSDLVGSDDPLVPEDLVLVPVRGEAQLPDSTPVEQEVPACLLRVAPRYDEQSRLWYADLGIAPAVAHRLTDRFVRLGLVRYQSHAREDRFDAPGQTRRSIRCSPPTTVWTVVPPRRELRATLTRDLHSPNASLLTVRLTGVGDPAPAVASLLPRAVVVFEILERTASNETVACDSDGKPLRADNQPANPAILEGTEHELRTWTGAFILPVPPTAAVGRYAILVSEADAFPRAGEARPKDVTCGPLRFFARLDLDMQA